MERPAIKQDLGVDEVEPAGFQHRNSLGLGLLKIYPSLTYRRSWIRTTRSLLASPRTDELRRRRR